MGLGNHPNCLKRGAYMNKDEFSGQWKTIKGQVKEQWGKLTDDDITRIEGKRDQLLGAIQKRYGYDKERAEQELSTWEEGFHSTEEPFVEEDIEQPRMKR